MSRKTKKLGLGMYAINELTFNALCLFSYASTDAAHIIITLNQTIKKCTLTKLNTFISQFRNSEKQILFLTQR